MHLIQLFNYQFQTEENLQPYIDQLFVQSSLMAYKVEISNYTMKTKNLIIYRVNIKRKDKKFVINFHIIKETNSLSFISIRFFEQNQPSTFFLMKSEHEFISLLQRLITLL